MGQVLDAVCECGYHSSVVMGAARSNFLEVCKFPHYCMNCHESISIDIFKETKLCPKCNSGDVHTYEAKTRRVRYKLLEKLSDNALQKLGMHRRDDEHHSWYGNSKNHTILRGKHYCPQCEKTTLSFITSMMFD
jgi:Zn finger protein HypA/HybF involved in hydrogenase expression